MRVLFKERSTEKSSLTKWLEDTERELKEVKKGSTQLHEKGHARRKKSQPELWVGVCLA